MYHDLARFLTTFSVDHPLWWALLVVAVISGCALAMYALWEGVIKALSAAFRRGDNPPGNASC